MNKHLRAAMQCVALIAIAILGFRATLESSSAASEPRRASGPAFEYGRLVIADTGYNWVVGDQQKTAPVSARVLIDRLGNGERRYTLGTLLNVLGKSGWELIMAVENDPEYGEPIWIFKRRI